MCVFVRSLIKTKAGVECEAVRPNMLRRACDGAVTLREHSHLRSAEHEMKMRRHAAAEVHLKRGEEEGGAIFASAPHHIMDYKAPRAAFCSQHTVPMTVGFLLLSYLC